METKKRDQGHSLVTWGSLIPPGPQLFTLLELTLDSVSSRHGVRADGGVRPGAGIRIELRSRSDRSLGKEEKRGMGSF